MARAGERVGRALGTGLRSARLGARRAGAVGMALSRQAAARAEQELASRGISTEELPELIAQRATGMSRRELAKRSRKARRQWERKAARSRKQLAKNAVAARKELAARIDPSLRRRRRRWPWALLVLTGMVVAVAVAFSRRPEELPVAGEDDFAQRNTKARHRAERADVPTQADSPVDAPERSR
ncbi:hypothetical protein [Saccharopolyspora thermophila]